MLKQLNKTLKFGANLIVTIILTLGFSISLQSLFAAWTAPNSNPPANNITDFTISGGLGVAGITALGGNFRIATGTGATLHESLFVNNTTGNVGIGTINPTEKLEVSGRIYSSSGGYIFPDGTTQTTAAVSGVDQWINGGNNIYNNNTGNVGIGTTTPNDKLTVVGNTILNGRIRNLTNSDFYIDSNDDMQLRINANGTGSGNFGINNSANSRLLTVLDNGNVGIGTANPSYLLTLFRGVAVGGHQLRITDSVHTLSFAAHANGSDITPGNGPLYLNYNTANNIIMNLVDGNVGIGLFNPSYKLDVNGVINGTSVLNPTYAP